MISATQACREEKPPKGSPRNFGVRNYVGDTWLDLGR